MIEPLLDRLLVEDVLNRYRTIKEEYVRSQSTSRESSLIARNITGLNTPQGTRITYTSTYDVAHRRHLFEHLSLRFNRSIYVNEFNYDGYTIVNVADIIKIKKFSRYL